MRQRREKPWVIGGDNQCGNMNVKCTNECCAASTKNTNDGSVNYLCSHDVEELSEPKN